MSHRFEGTREQGDRLAVCGAGEGAESGLIELLRGLLPQLPFVRVVGVAIQEVGGGLLAESLQRPDNPRMKPSPVRLGERAVGYFVGEGMLEGESGLGAQARFVDELTPSQLGQSRG